MSIAAIITALTAIDVDGETVYTGSTLPDSLATADLPARVIDIEKTETLEWVSLGGVATVNHIINDTYYLAPVAQGSGLDDNRAALIAYTDAYIAAIVANLRLSGVAEIIDIETVPTVIEYAAAGTYYFAVRSLLTVRERF